MRRTLTALALVFALPSPARGVEAGCDLELFLVEDKVMAGGAVWFRLSSWLDLDLELAPIFTTDDPPDDGLDGHFVGALLGAHLAARIVDLDMAVLRVGAGLDAFSLLGVHSEEWKLGLPVLAELRVPMTETLWAVGEGRYYVIHHEGLEVGVRRSGEETLPFVILAGIGGEL